MNFAKNLNLWQAKSIGSNYIDRMAVN